jgi:GT2 family glycosyltransferase
MTSTLSFIIVNWNGGELLKRCLGSIANYPPSISFDIWVVDNDSTDGSREWLRSAEATALFSNSQLQLVENSENLGFGAANNRAFKLTSAPLIFLLNPDTEVTAGSVDSLIAVLRSSERIGMAGPKLVNEDGSVQVSVWRTVPEAWEALLTGFRLHKLIPRRARGELLLADHWDYSRRRDVGQLSGAAMMLKREVLDEVGGFDERFHMYGEDAEWCVRIGRAGWRIVFEPAAVIRHLGAASSLKRWTPLEKQRVQSEAFLALLRYTLPWRRRVTNLAVRSLLLALQRAARRLRGRERAEVEQTLRLFTADLRRALRGD